LGNGRGLSSCCLRRNKYKKGEGKIGGKVKEKGNREGLGVKRDAKWGK
jgi:hypothetical protein